MAACLPSLDTLEAPTLTALLSCRGSLPDIAAAALPDSVSGLDADVVYIVCEWALVAFSTSDEAFELAYMCAVFSMPPSAYLHIADPVLAYELDRRCAARIQGRGGSEQAEEEGTHFTTGGPAE